MITKTDMKKVLLFALTGAILAFICIVSPSCKPTGGNSSADTLKINTTTLGADIIGYMGPTPLEISVYKGVITDIKTLPNQETPRFQQRVLDSGLLSQLVGKTVKEAKAMKLDAVSGATFTSTAMIKNIQIGLENIGKPVREPKVITQAKVKQGKVQGYVENGLGTFKAIPYAEAPVGELRWKAPVPKEKWDGVRQATETSAGIFMARCP